MKILLDYEPITGTLTDKNGIIALQQGMIGFDQEKPISETTLELIKQDVSPEDIIKMKNNGLI